MTKIYFRNCMQKTNLCIRNCLRRTLKHFALALLFLVYDARVSQSSTREVIRARIKLMLRFRAPSFFSRPTYRRTESNDDGDIPRDALSSRRYSRILHLARCQKYFRLDDSRKSYSDAIFTKMRRAFCLSRNFVAIL